MPSLKLMPHPGNWILKDAPVKFFANHFLEPLLLPLTPLAPGDLVILFASRQPLKMHIVYIYIYCCVSLVGYESCFGRTSTSNGYENNSIKTGMKTGYENNVQTETCKNSLFSARRV